MCRRERWPMHIVGPLFTKAVENHAFRRPCSEKSRMDLFRACPSLLVVVRAVATATGAATLQKWRPYSFTACTLRIKATCRRRLSDEKFMFGGTQQMAAEPGHIARRRVPGTSHHQRAKPPSKSRIFARTRASRCSLCRILASSISPHRAASSSACITK